MNKPTTAVLLSGGLDSTTLLALAARDTDLRLAVSVEYGQRHYRELNAARRVADYYAVPHIVLDLTGWGKLITGSALTDPTVEVPEGAYDGANMADTVVPNRNAVMLMAAAGIAAAKHLDEVWTAVHGGDHHIYPDCRPDFIESADETAQLGTGGQVRILAPFVNVTKARIVQLGAELGAPLDTTWSCYRGLSRHCGVCGTCVERREAFTVAGIPDPTHYAQA